MKNKIQWITMMTQYFDGCLEIKLDEDDSLPPSLGVDEGCL